MIICGRLLLKIFPSWGGGGGGGGGGGDYSRDGYYSRKCCIIFALVGIMFMVRF